MQLVSFSKFGYYHFRRRKSFYELNCAKQGVALPRILLVKDNYIAL